MRDARRQLHLRLARLQLRVRLVIDLHLVAALLLGRVAGGVGQRQQALDTRRLGSHLHQPDAHAHRIDLPAPREAVVGNRAAQALGGLPAFVGIGAVHQRREVVAAQARDDVLRRQGAAQQVADLAQQLVAGHVAGGVVDQLELVEVEVQQRVLHAPGREPRQQHRQRLLEGGAVEQPRQVVVAREEVELILRLAALADLLRQLGIRQAQLLRALGHAALELVTRVAQARVVALQLAQQAADAQVRVHARQQFGQAHRLGDVVDAAGGEAGAGIVAARGDEDDGDRRQRGRGLQPPAHLEAVHARHHHVEQDQVRAQRVGQLQRAHAAVRQRHLMAQRDEQVGQDLGVDRRVVDHQDLRRLRRSAVYCLARHDRPHSPRAPACAMSGLSMIGGELERE